MDDAHSKTSDEVKFFFKTDEATGLSDSQVAEYQEEYGPNGGWKRGLCGGFGGGLRGGVGGMFVRLRRGF